MRPKRIAAEMKVGDRGFHFKHFKGYRPDKIGRGRIAQIAKREIFGAGGGNELFANLIIVHWNEAKRDLYREMVAHVQTIDEDVEKVERIDDAKANTMIDDLLERHDRRDILLCVRLNGVRFGAGLIEARLVRGEATYVADEAASDEAASDETATDEAASDEAASDEAEASADAAADSDEPAAAPGDGEAEEPAAG